MKPTFFTVVSKAIQDGASAYLWGLISPHSPSSLVLYPCQKFAPFPTHSEVRYHSHILCSFPSIPLTPATPPAWNTYTPPSCWPLPILPVSAQTSLPTGASPVVPTTASDPPTPQDLVLHIVSICLTGCCHHFTLRPMRQGIRFVLIHTVFPPPRTMHILGTPWWSSG